MIWPSLFVHFIANKKKKTKIGLLTTNYILRKCHIAISIQFSFSIVCIYLCITCEIYQSHILNVHSYVLLADNFIFFIFLFIENGLTKSNIFKCFSIFRFIFFSASSVYGYTYQSIVLYLSLSPYSGINEQWTCFQAREFFFLLLLFRVKI